MEERYFVKYSAICTQKYGEINLLVEDMLDKQNIVLVKKWTYVFSPDVNQIGLYLAHRDLWESILVKKVFHSSFIETLNGVDIRLNQKRFSEINDAINYVKKLLLILGDVKTEKYRLYYSKENNQLKLSILKETLENPVLEHEVDLQDNLNAMSVYELLSKNQITKEGYYPVMFDTKTSAISFLEHILN